MSQFTDWLVFEVSRTGLEKVFNDIVFPRIPEELALRPISFKAKPDQWGDSCIYVRHGDKPERKVCSLLDILKSADCCNVYSGDGGAEEWYWTRNGVRIDLDDDELMACLMEECTLYNEGWVLALKYCVSDPGVQDVDWEIFKKGWITGIMCDVHLRDA